MGGAGATGGGGPEAAFGDRIVVLAPHMDDETLGCGGLLALLSPTREIDVVFATDGSGSPAPPGGRAGDPARLAALREEEAAEALCVLGVPRGRLHFLRFPDGGLARNETGLRQALAATAAGWGPAEFLVPFRQDWHPDHLAAYRAAAAALAAGDLKGRLVEYFVYTRRRLLPGGDVRAYVRPSRLARVPIEAVADRKLGALGRYRSQTTLFYPGQGRPVLGPELVRRACEEPECFLTPAPDGEDRGGLRVGGLIRAATLLEPALKRLKDRVWAGGAR
ncbi:MAG: PIG-L family deacetylase [Deferrisomatales bacterium]|nr:PIG-L family deacetylase [Deferrisomatales bacterium]